MQRADQAWRSAREARRWPFADRSLPINIGSSRKNACSSNAIGPDVAKNVRIRQVIAPSSTKNGRSSTRSRRSIGQERPFFAAERALTREERRSIAQEQAFFGRIGAFFDEERLLTGEEHVFS
jgi:hypothetical protein